MPPIDQRELLRRLYRVSGQLRAIAEHVKQLAADLDELIDQHLPPPGSPPIPPLPAPPSP
jgi:DNA-binding FrmR family transcriptional regulator